jgi:hypothetical protein
MELHFQTGGGQGLRMKPGDEAGRLLGAFLFSAIPVRDG